ncbi:MAG: hypothetical protein FJX45_09715 [Alphaproteobacteria bacterium]|nr:hypothetical protein [Alphaproteobacteria bacterium]MBM3651955.1 hypothetical protein [Alphaproteobacteria bacterium]
MIKLLRPFPYAAVQSSTRVDLPEIIGLSQTPRARFGEGSSLGADRVKIERHAVDEPFPVIQPLDDAVLE